MSPLCRKSGTALTVKMVNGCGMVFDLAPNSGMQVCRWALSIGLRALVNWVEHGHAPGALRVVQVKMLGGKTICERVQMPY
jgi:hypothetical protein